MSKFIWILFSFSYAIPCPQNTMYLIGSYRPQCQDDGSWSPKQCWGSVGSCWCVDSEGNRLTEDTTLELDCATVSTDNHNVDNSQK